MPHTTEEKIEAKSVAIIGGGPSGIASLYDLTRALKDGTSAFAEKSVERYEEAHQNAFEEVVLFERNPSFGGVWSSSSSGNKNKDLNLPKFDLVGTTDLQDPDKVFIRAEISDELESQLQNSSKSNPILIKKTEMDPSDTHQWKSSAAYEELFTNVTNRYMSFSFDELSKSELEELSNRYKYLKQFQTAKDVGKYLDKVVRNNNLQKHIRTNSNVERARKLNSGKWELVIKEQEISETDSIIVDKWYKQEFDTVVIANGKTVPIVPTFKNLKEFSEINKDKVTITLAKAIKNVEFIERSKKILFIGSSVSSIDLLQYAFPRDLSKPSIYISRRSGAGSNKGSAWVRLCSYSRGIINKPEIEKFIPETNSVQFTDGSIESDFDTIIIATGYHMYYPFLEKEYLKTHNDLTKFYLYTFSIDDPTLALVGNTYASFFFNRVECQAAALAAVWSGQQVLPSKEDQQKWYEEKFKQPLLEITVKKFFSDPLIELALEGRPNPFDYTEDKLDHVNHSGQGKRIVEELFFKLRDGEVKHRELI